MPRVTPSDRETAGNCKISCLSGRTGLKQGVCKERIAHKKNKEKNL